MIEETGTVVAESGNDVWVQTIRKSTCSGCSARHGCGQGVLARLSDGRASQVLVHNGAGGQVRVGDQVVIGIEESLLLRASFLVYGLPLVMLVLSAVLADWFWPGSELIAIVFAAGGLGLGFGMVRVHGLLHEGGRPILLSRAPLKSAKAID